MRHRGIILKIHEWIFILYSINVIFSTAVEAENTTSSSSMTANQSSVNASNSYFPVVSPTITVNQNSTSLNSSSAIITTPIIAPTAATTSDDVTPTTTSATTSTNASVLTSNILTTAAQNTTTAGTAQAMTSATIQSPASTSAAQNTNAGSTQTTTSTPATTQSTASTSAAQNTNAGSTQTTTSTPATTQSPASTSAAQNTNAGSTQTTTSTPATSQSTASTSAAQTTTTAGATQTTTSTPATSQSTASTSAAQTTTTAGVTQPTTTGTSQTSTSVSTTPSTPTTPTSSVTPTSKPPILTTRIEGSVKLMIPWNVKLLEKTSSVYKEMEKNFTDAIKILYETQNVSVEVIVTNIKEGSTIIVYVLIIKGVTKESDPQSLLTLAIKRGTIGNLEVDSTYVETKTVYPGLEMGDYETVVDSFLDNCCSSHIGLVNQTRSCKAAFSNVTCSGSVLYQSVKCEDVKDQKCSAASLKQTIALILVLIVGRMLL